MNIRKLIQTPNEEEYLYALALRAFGTGPEAEQANEEMKELMATWRPAKRRRMADCSGIGPSNLKSTCT